MAIEVINPDASESENIEERNANNERFGTELEFVQCLSCPFYLSSLAQQGYFDDPAFLSYLNYLKRIWQQPRYARFLTYPQALAVLDLLESSRFREGLRHEDKVNELARLQIAHWATHRMVEPRNVATDSSTAQVIPPSRG